MLQVWATSREVSGAFGAGHRVSVRKPAFGVSFVEIEQETRREPGTAPKQRRTPSKEPEANRLRVGAGAWQEGGGPPRARRCASRLAAPLRPGFGPVAWPGRGHGRRRPGRNASSPPARTPPRC